MRSSGRWGLRLARWVHGAALRLLPRRFRRRFEDEIRDAFEEGAWEVWLRGGTWGICSWTLRALVDVVRHATLGRAALVVTDGPDEPVPVWTTRRGGGGTMADLKNGIRQLTRRPALSLAAVLTLALGIGATTSMFSVVNGVLLAALPYPDPDRLVRLYHANPERGTDRGALSVPDLEDWARSARSFEAMAVYSDLPSGPLFTSGDEPLELRTTYVSDQFFTTLGVPAALGTGLVPEAEARDNRVVVFSHGFWQSALGGDPAIVGGTVTLDDEPYRVAGVMPADFDYPHGDVQAWLFLSVIPPSSIPLHLREVRFLEAVGRLRDGITTERAQAELSAVSRALALEFPDENEGLTAARLVPLRETITRGVSRPLLVLLLGVSAVLLIACVNVASLLLSRGVERMREVALRSALGADRKRILRQFVTEALVLAAVGGFLGVGVAVLLHGTLTHQLGGLLPKVTAIRLDGTVLSFAAVTTTLSALLFGAAPAVAVTAGAPVRHLHDGGRGASAGRGSRRIWSVLVATEVALALVLVIASGLLLRSLWALQRVDPGLDADRLVALTLTFNDSRYPERPAYLEAYTRTLERLSAVPGVLGVGSIRYAPTHLPGEEVGFRIVGRQAPDGSRPSARLLQVSPGFFSVVGAGIEAGRELTISA